MATTAQEVEAIVVRLTGDGSQYNRMMSQAQTTTRTTGNIIHNIARDVDGFGNTLSRFGEAAVAGYGLNQLRGMLDHAFDAFSEAELIGLRLTATLEANGREVEALTAQYGRFAEEMENLTTQEDDAILSMLRMAETFDVTGTAAQRAVSDAVSLAAVTGGQAESLIRLTAAIAKGDIEQAQRYARMVPQLRGIRDQNEFLAKAELLVASGAKAANAEMQSTSGILKMLHRDYGNMLEDVGKVISEGVKPLASGLRDIIASIRALDEPTRRFLTQLVLITTALLSLGPQIALFRATGLPALRMMVDGFQILWYLVTLLVKPLTIIGGLWATIAALGGAIFSGAGVAILAVALAIGIFIDRMGGIRRAMTAVRDWAYDVWGKVSTFAMVTWEKTKIYAEAFLLWFAPIWRAIGQLGRTAWNLIVQGAEWAWDMAVTGWTAARELLSTIWVAIFGDAEINWTAVRDFIADAIMFVEFSLLNMGQVAEYVWAGMKLYAVVAFNFILANANTIMTGGMNLVFETIYDNWSEIMSAMGRAARTTFSAMVSAAALAGGAIMAAISGRLNPAALGAMLGRIAGTITSSVSISLRGISIRQLQDLEAQLRADFNRLGSALGMDFARFRADRLAELGLSPEEIRAAERAGEEIGGAINRGMGDPLKRLEGTIFNSMEAYSRLLDYRERVLRPGDRPTPALGGESAGVVSPILRRIAIATERMAGRPPVVVEGAGL